MDHSHGTGGNLFFSATLETNLVDVAVVQQTDAAVERVGDVRDHRPLFVVVRTTLGTVAALATVAHVQFKSLRGDP